MARIVYTVGYMQKRGQPNEPYWSMVWHDDTGNLLVWDTRNQAMNKAIEEAKDNPGDTYYVFEAVESVICPVGEPAVSQLKRGMEEFGV